LVNPYLHVVRTPYLAVVGKSAVFQRDPNIAVDLLYTTKRQNLGC